MKPSNLSSYLRPYLKWAIAAPLWMMGEVTLDLMQPRLLQRVVDQGIARGDMTLVWHTSLLMLLFAAMGVIAGMGCTFCAVRAAQGFGADVRQALFAKVQSLSFKVLDGWGSGALITRLSNDVTQVQEVVMMLLRVMVRVPLLLVGSLIMATLTSPRLALLYIPLVPIVMLIVAVIITRTYPLFALVQARLDALNTTIQENLSGVRVVKAFAREPYEAARFQSANAALTEKNIQTGRLGAATMPLMMIALNAGVVAALWMGGLGVKNGGMGEGQIIAFVNYLSQTLMSLMMVSMLVVRLARAQASAKRIGEVMDAQTEITSPQTAFAPLTVRGHITFENVSFSYAEDAERVLCDISFEALPGQTVAVLGATGEGKSTLVNLIPRFYDVSSGCVTLDGTDVRDWDLNALRGSVGVALQESVLFSGTIRDNIAYGRPDARDEEILAAARASQADEFIARLPDGYATLVGARGVNLSGGQKQRIAIARALLLGSPVLILDDSTSAVDVTTEARIQSALALEHADQTRILVAQRISTVKNADLILILDEGRIAARGTHDELLQTSPIYREIAESQLESEVLAHEIA